MSEAEAQPRVLIVDDDPVARLLAGKALARIGFVVNEVVDGDLALAALDRELPDLVLLDIEMPGLGGFETCRILRQRYPQASLPVLMATGHTDAETINRAFESGATDFVKKPIDWELLQHRVRFIMRGSEAIVRLREVQRAAEAASRAKLDFLSNMSHEIRTPMTAIVGFIEQLHGENAAALGESDRTHAVGAIQRNSTRLLQLLDDMLEVCRAEGERPRLRLVPTDPRRVVHDVTGTFRPDAEARGLHLRTHREAHAGRTLYTDPVRLRQLLFHLVSNAVKFTDSGVIDVGTTWVSGPGEQAICELWVRDTGIGMTQEETERVFAAFTQADESLVRSRGGAGLGLSLVRLQVEALRGELRVTSRPGEGTEFRVRLPSLSQQVAAPEVVATPPAAPASASASTHQVAVGRRVLLVEDSPDNQRLIAFLVRKLGALVEVVENGREGVDAALGAEQREPYDLILMDMQMPVLDGYSATAELRRAGYRRPIVALTAHAMQGDRERCLEAGCDDYASKPLNGATVRRILEQWLRAKDESPV